MEWWGHSKEHGWVVLDRGMADNASGPKQTLMFVRMRDSTTYLDTRKNWNPPLYNFAPNYIRDLPPAEAAKATAEWAELKTLWPAVQQKIQQAHQDVIDKAEAERVALEAAEKKAARDKKKQLGLAAP